MTTTEYDDGTHGPNDGGTQTYPVKTILPATNSFSHIVENEYDYRFGKVKQVKDENGNLTKYIYDEFGRLRQMDAPDGGQVVNEYHDFQGVYGYPNFTPFRHVITRAKENSLGNTIATYTFYDGLGRPIKTLAPGENGKLVVTGTQYDDMGRACRKEGPYFSAASADGSIDYMYLYPPPYTNPGPAYPFSQTYYDDLGRPETIISNSEPAEYPDGPKPKKTTFSYYGLATTVTDPDGKSKTEEKDYLGRLREVVEHAGAEWMYTYYDYNAAGDLKKVTDAGGKTTAIYYDSLGRKISMTDPDMGFWQYRYDFNDNLTWQKDANGQETTLFYDPLNRLTTKQYNTTGMNTVQYEYDAATNGIGRLSRVSNSDVTTQYTAYDALGRLKNVTKYIFGLSQNLTSSYEYDLLGRTKHLTYPNGFGLDYHYYPGTGLLKDVFGVSDSTTYATFSLYEPTGKIGQVVYGNGTKTQYIYNPGTTRLTDLKDDKPYAGTGVIQQKKFFYSTAGDIEKIRDDRQGITYRYTYDSLHRLTGEAASSTLTQTPVATAQPTLANTYFTATEKGPWHAVKSVNSSGKQYIYSYDANGNMKTGYDFSDPINVATRTFTYNADNMPTAITHSVHGTTTIVYDGNGTRAKKIRPNRSTTYYISPDFEVTDGIATLNIYAGNTRIAMLTGLSPSQYNPATAIRSYFHRDHLGSSTVLTSDTAPSRRAIPTSPSGGSVTANPPSPRSPITSIPIRSMTRKQGFTITRPVCMIPWLAASLPRILWCRILPTLRV